MRRTPTASAVTVFSNQAHGVARGAPSTDLAVGLVALLARRHMLPRDPIRGHCQAGSLTGAVHLSKNNAGVLRPAQRGQKPRVEQKGKSWLDPGVQYAQGLRKHGLSILLA